MIEVLEKIHHRAAKRRMAIVLPEANDIRVLKAAEIIGRDELAKVILLGQEEQIRSTGEFLGLALNDIDIVDYRRKKIDSYRDLLFEIRRHKGLKREEAAHLIANPLYYGMMMVKSGDADGLVAGSLSPTADVLRPALQIIKMSPGLSVISGAFIMIMPTSEYGDDGVMLFADCAVTPNPTAEQLADIAFETAETAQKVLGLMPRIGMLSFSTKGSAAHGMVEKVREATALARKKYPHLIIDGELQADAALVPTIGAHKAPGSKVAGKVNILIFPDLQSGNIGYKLGQRLAGAEAVGPILQGMAGPVNDLSRGCSVEDIVNMTAITAVQAQLAGNFRLDKN